MNNIKYSILSACLLLFQSMSVNSASVGYTDIVAFESAISGYSSNVISFDSMSDQDLLPSGGGLEGLMFNYDFGGYSMMVVDSSIVGLSTTSQTNYLATNNGDVFQDGDNFTITFDNTVNAFGLSIMTSDLMYDNDISLTTNNGSVNLLGLNIQQTLADGSSVYFLGLIDTVGFNTVEFNTIGGGFFLYTLDDLQTAVVPLPSAVWLFVSGILGMITVFRRKN